MKKLLMCLAGYALLGCVGGTRNAPPAEVYDFGMPIERPDAGGRWSTLALEIRAPHWFDSRDIEYRLLFENPLKMRHYAGSRWAGAPGLLLSQRLRQELGFVGVNGHFAASCLLRLELDEFSQAFDTPQSSRGVLRGRAFMLDARHRIVAERSVAVEQPAPSADARGGVMALAMASEELTRQLDAWLNDLEKRGRLIGCRSTAGESQ